MIPKIIIAGDSLEVEYVDDDYSADDGYTATLMMKGPTLISLTATSESTTHTFSATPLVTKVWPAGTYKYIVVMSDGSGGETTVNTGTLNIELRIDLTTETEFTTYNQSMLTAIQSLLMGRAIDGIESYSIAGRSIQKMTTEQLIKFEAIFARRVANENQNSRLRQIRAIY